MLVGSLVGFALLRFGFRTEGVSTLEKLPPIPFLLYSVTGMMLAGFLLVTIFGAPFHCLRYLFDSERVRAVGTSRSMPPSKVNDAFIGEAQRIINALEQGRQGEVTGTFDLPIYKQRAEHEKWKNEPEGQFRRTNQSRSIALVAGTRPELEKRLSSEWKTLVQG
jgi:hypothetical protein